MTPLFFRNIVDVYWGINCRGAEDIPVRHSLCFGLLEQPPEDTFIPEAKDFTRCVCPCHDGFDPMTGER